MINFKSDNGSIRLEMRGGLSELESDVTMFVRNVYLGIKKQDEKAARLFKTAITDNLCKLAFVDNVSEAVENGLADILKELAKTAEGARNSEKTGKISEILKKCDELISELDGGEDEDDED